MGDTSELLDVSHIKILKSFQKALEKRGRVITESELLAALIEFVAERKNVFIKSLAPDEEKNPLEKWLEKITTKPSSEKKERNSA